MNHGFISVHHTISVDQYLALDFFVVKVGFHFLHTLIDQELEASMAAIRTVVRLGHNIRKQHALRVRQPLSSVTVLTRDADVEAAVASHVELITDELNVKVVTTSADEGDLIDLGVAAEVIDKSGGSGAFLREEANRWKSDLQQRFPGSKWAKKAKSE